MVMRMFIKTAVLCLLLLLNVVVTVFAQDKRNQDELVIFPAPPDTTRIQFLTKISNSIDVTGKRSGILKYIMGDAKGEPIIKPYGLAIRKGMIYICDTMVGGLEVIDLEKKKFEYFRPSGLGAIKKPINCFIDKDDYLFITDTGRKQVVIFNQDRQFVKAIGDPKTMKPTDVFVTDGKIWVCDLGTQKIRVYDKKNYELLFTFPDAVTGDPEYLYSPTNLYVTQDQVYVSDIGDFKVKIYDLTGNFKQSFGSYGRNIGQFVRPKGISVDKSGNIYVADAGFENVQIFNKDNQLLMFFGGTYKGLGTMWLPAKVVIDYDNLKYFQKYVYKDFRLKYLIFVTNQYGPDKINVYGYVEPK